MKILMSAAIAAMLLAMAACAADEDTNDAMAVDAVERDQMPMDGMPGMAGMQDDGMMRQMQARMATMMATNPDSMMAMMPMHRQMAANMLAQMNREMREMDMAEDEAWTATVDSLRQDLTRMPEMSPDEMAAIMPGHRARMNRLMEMHRSMMGSGAM
jgi:hypothetical protein